MNFPIAQHIDDILIASNLLPHDRIVNIDDINGLNGNDIEILQKYFYYTYPTYISLENYFCIKEIAKFMFEVLNIVEDKSVVICPGDSVFKIVTIIRMLFNKQEYGENIYIYELEGRTYKKEINFITFPLSGITNFSYTKESIDNHINRYIGDYSVQIRNRETTTYIFDFVFWGNSVRAIFNSLKRSYGIEAKLINFNVISDNSHAYLGMPDDYAGHSNLEKWSRKHLFDKNIEYRAIPTEKNLIYSNYNQLYGSPLTGPRRKCSNTINCLFINTERCGCRCVDKYEINSTPVSYDRFRCNVVIAIIVLLYRENLVTPDLDYITKEDFSILRENIIVDSSIITYYDLSKLEVVREQLTPTTWKDIESNRLYNTIISIEN